ncbi:hypothetical protein A136_10540 [Vibrio crassostreae 9ZC13]|nr:hypothetical protein A136_10540 [Vibrio crassostreae 9ZC13]
MFWHGECQIEGQISAANINECFIGKNQTMVTTYEAEIRYILYGEITIAGTVLLRIDKYT